MKNIIVIWIACGMFSVGLRPPEDWRLETWSGFVITCAVHMALWPINIGDYVRNRIEMDDASDT